MSLPGVDVNLGLARTLGNAELYQRILRLFLEREHAFMTQWQAAWERQDFDTVKRLLHTMQSVAGTLGAQGLAQACQQVASDVRSQASAEQLERSVQTLRSAFEEVLASIDAALAVQRS